MTQYESILAILRDKQWHTAQEIAERAQCPHGSVGSQIRNARVEGYVIIKERTAPRSGLWHYRWTGEIKLMIP